MSRSLHGSIVGGKRGVQPECVVSDFDNSGGCVLTKTLTLGPILLGNDIMEDFGSVIEKCDSLILLIPNWGPTCQLVSLT